MDTSYQKLISMCLMMSVILQAFPMTLGASFGFSIPNVFEDKKSEKSDSSWDVSKFVPNIELPQIPMVFNIFDQPKDIPANNHNKLDKPCAHRDCKMNDKKKDQNGFSNQPQPMDVSLPIYNIENSKPSSESQTVNSNIGDAVEEEAPNSLGNTDGLGFPAAENHGYDNSETDSTPFDDSADEYTTTEDNWTTTDVPLGNRIAGPVVASILG